MERGFSPAFTARLGLAALQAAEKRFSEGVILSAAKDLLFAHRALAPEAIPLLRTVCTSAAKQAAENS